MEAVSSVKYNPNFSARFVAKTVNHVGNLNTKIDIWELNARDSVILKKILHNTDMQKLMPEVSNIDAKRWGEMLEIAVDDTISRGSQTFLAVTENKPCGIMSVIPGKKNFRASCVCTWPVETGKKVKLAGKTLFYQLFKTFNQSKAQGITLEAIQDGPFKTIPKYQELGFKILNNDRLVSMNTNKDRVKDTCTRLDKMIDYVAIKDSSSKNLSDVLVI